MKLSIVTTLYKSAPFIGEFHRRASAAARQFAGDDYEVVYVNDGSPDDSLEVAVSITHTDEHAVVVDLSRNFGHHKAMMTGLAHAEGDFVFLIDSDLEEDPDWLSGFSVALAAQNADVVFGVQQQRKGKTFERLSGQLFWRVFNFMTDLQLADNITTARLMTRRYVDALLRHDEREVFIGGLWHITGFKQVSLSVVKGSRTGSTYTLRKKLSLLVNSITSFSNAPLVYIFYLGFAISFAALFYILFLAVNWLLISKPMSGWTSVMASIWLLGGMIMSSIGIVGIYVSKIFSETKRRPYTIVRQVFGRDRR